MNSKVEIFVVSLRKYSKYSFLRTQELEKEIEGKLNFPRNKIRWIGVNGLFLRGKKINPIYIEKPFFSEHFMNLGSLGCILSHLCILKIIEKQKIFKDILVLEEDARLNGNAKDFDLSISLLPEDYDLASFYDYSEQNFYNQCGEDDPNFKLNYVDDKIREENKLFYFKRIIRKNIFPGGAQCYVINGRRIDRIIEHLLPVGSALDFHYWSHYHQYNLNKYIINPNTKLCSPPPRISIRYELDKFGSNQIKTNKLIV